MKLKILIAFLIIVKLSFMGLVGFLFFKQLDVGIWENRQTAIDYMPIAEKNFLERKKEFEKMEKIMINKNNVTVDYDNGLSINFIHDKEGVMFGDKWPEFSDADKQGIMDFFQGQTSGDDLDRLEMLKVSKNSDDVEFQVFSSGQYKVYFVHKPGNILYPAYETKDVADGWVMMAIDTDMPTEEIFSRYDGNDTLQ